MLIKQYCVKIIFT